MSKFIEVFGESEYQEYPLKLVIDIDVSIRAVKEETAKTEIQDIVNDILDKLFENGLSKNDVTFGGRETFTPSQESYEAAIPNTLEVYSDIRFCPS